MNELSNKSGTVLLYSLLIISLITAIAITVSIIVINEIKLTSGAANATLAYYAAEAGIEKGLYAVKIYRNDPAVNLGDAVTIIQGYIDGTFVNGTEYSNDQTFSLISKVEGEEIKEYQYLQIDYYDVDNPLTPADTVAEINVKNEGDNPFSWAEVSWTAWDDQGELLTSTEAKKVVGPTDLQNYGWPIILKNAFSVDPVGYRIRIKALFGDLSSLTVTPSPDVDLPSQLVIKSVGERGKFKQSLTATVPWKIPLFGLYDYVLFSEESLIKTIILSREIYTSGAIQVEDDISVSGSCTGCSQWEDEGYYGCTDWSAVCCAKWASCEVGSGTDDMCTIDGAEFKEHWVLPIPDYVPADEDYYLSIRVKYSGSVGNMRFILGETCKDVPIQGAVDEWVSCTISEADFSTISNTNMKFEKKGSGTVDIDWYQLSTYKIFDDCSGVDSCTVPTPDCGNCICETGETCPADSMDCADQDIQCKVPSCIDGCVMVNVQDDYADPDCLGDICCSGACTTPVCTVDADCPDADVDPCTVDACQDGDTCNAQCYISQTISTCYDDSYGCCPAGCTSLNDADCVSPPDKEYLRYIAFDENGVDLTTLNFSGRSMREVPVWKIQNTSGNFLRDVWGADANNIWAVGAGGTVMNTTDGTNWNAPVTVGSNEFRGIYGLSTTSIWAVGANKTMYYYDGNIWTDLSTYLPPGIGSTDWIYSVWVYGVNDVWIAGGLNAVSGWVYHCSSGCNSSTPTWDAVQLSIGDRLHDIWGVDTSNIWAVGDGEVIYEYDGSLWINRNTGTAILLGISGTSDGNHIWAVGTGGAVHYCNNCVDTPDNWVPHTLPVAGAASYDVTAFYDGGNIRAVIGGQTNTYFYNGASWVQQTIGSSPLTYYGVFGTDIENVWVVGQDETILFANALGEEIMDIGRGSGGNLFDQYWYSKKFTNIALPAGLYSANLYVPSEDISGGKHITFLLHVGYCDDASGDGMPCSTGDNYVTKATSSEIDYGGNTATGVFHNETIGNWDVDHSCTVADSCRLWFKLETTAGTYPYPNHFDLQIGGTVNNNSNVDVP